MTKKTYFIALLGSLLVGSGVICFMSLIDSQNSTSEKLTGIPVNSTIRSQEVSDEVIEVPDWFPDFKTTTNNSKKVSNDSKGYDDFEDSDDGSAKTSEDGSGASNKYGDRIVDYDWSIQTKTGDLYCYLSHMYNGYEFDEPVYSKRIYKYCMYGWGEDQKVWLGGCGKDEESYAMFEKKFAKNPGNPIILLAEVRWQKWVDNVTLVFRTTLSKSTIKTRPCSNLFAALQDATFPDLLPTSWNITLQTIFQWLFFNSYL